MFSIQKHVFNIIFLKLNKKFNKYIEIPKTLIPVV